MLEIIYETSNLNLIISIIEVNESDLNEKEWFNIQSFIEKETDQTADQQADKSTDRLKDKEVKYLFSLSSSDSSTSTFESVEESIKIKTTKMIELDVDTTNIIFEKMRRRRNTRKQTYLVVLDEVADDEILSFHTAFFAFISASAYYNTFANANQAINQIKFSFKNLKLITSSFHKNALLSKSRNFRQMQKHSHSADFI
jgi:hypothetical protein